MHKVRFKRLGASITAAVIMASSLLVPPPAANAVATKVETAKGRATGSGKWGYVGQFGKLNKSTKPAHGEFFLPYAIDIEGDKIAVTDAGIASWESGTKAAGHSVQVFTKNAEPGSAGHGDYLGNGEYDIVDDKSSQIDPAGFLNLTGYDYYETTEPRGPRGVAFGLGDTVHASSFETPRMRTYADSTLSTATIWGDAADRQPGNIAGATAVDTDSQGNVYTGTNFGVSVSDKDGNFITAISVYYDQNGENQSGRVTWGTRNTTVPTAFTKPDFIGETYGLSVAEENGQTVVYVGDAGAYYQPDPAVHFQTGSAQGTKPASIKKYILTPSGGTVNARYNPAGWKWTLDTNFGTDGAVQFNQNSLYSFFGRYLFRGQTVFGVEADAKSNTLYYSLNGQTGVKMGALDMKTGLEKEAPAEVNSPGIQQDSRQNTVRGIAVDERGLVYATTQDSTTTGTSRAIVQIWGKTPTSIANTATAETTKDTATLTWAESTVGYQQPDLLDYVVKYRKVGDTEWLSTDRGISKERTHTLSNLEMCTEYEAVITPYNEAGSGDAAEVKFKTKCAEPAISVVKKGYDLESRDAANPYKVAADSEVEFTYTVTNTGNVDLTDVKLVDDQIANVSVSDPANFDGTLKEGEKVTFKATGTVGAGAYTNTATATGKNGDETVSAKDVWHGFGIKGGLTLTKTGNGKAAQTESDQVQVPAGSDVVFNYTITNTGNYEVTGVELVDDQLGAIAAPAGFNGTLAAGESVTYSATGPVATGAYKNTATVSGATPIGPELIANDIWHGFGVEGAISVVKTGNDVANEQSNPLHVPAGSDVVFKYTITNGGNSELTIGDVVDSELGIVPFPAGFTGTLAAGESVTFTATGQVAEGDYTNTVTIDSTDATGTHYTAEDSWYGFGYTAGLKVVKTGDNVESRDADNPRKVKADTDVEFTYTVTNTGNVALADLQVVDDKIGTIAAPEGFNGTLAAGESVIFTASGTVPEGEYENTATATAKIDNTTATAEDVWYGLGIKEIKPVTIVAPEAHDPASCTASPWFVISKTEGVDFTVTVDGKPYTDWEYGVPHSYGYGKKLVITASTREGYEFARVAQTEWTFPAFGRPENCDTPVDPVDPAKPIIPIPIPIPVNPTNPANPATPVAPASPVTPVKPGESHTPSADAKNSTGSKALAVTGTSGAVILAAIAGLLLAGLGTLMLFLRRHKRPKA